MSMDKAIKYGKEHRKIYYGAQAIDKTCRPGGSCLFCQSNRTYKNKKREHAAKFKMKEVD